MAGEAMNELSHQLRGRVPPGLTRLSEADLRDLAQAVADARHREGEAIIAAGEHALDRVPRLLRAAIRRVVR